MPSQEAAPEEQTLDWHYICSTFIDVSDQLRTITKLLSSERVYFDFRDVLRDTKDLNKKINNVYSLLCTASQLDELDLDAGASLATVRRLVDIRRAEIVDAELTFMQRPPASDAPTWGLDYRPEGGFLATSEFTDGSQPWLFWGMAPTEESAAHTLRWYFLDHPPHITGFRQDEQRPYLRPNLDSDISLEGPQVRDLLDRRGPVYDEHIAACESAREVLTHCNDLQDHLAKRANELNATEPQLGTGEHDILRPLTRSGDHDGFTETVHWVPAHLVVSTNHPSWGDFEGHRDKMPFHIVDGLLSNDLEVFTYELFTDEISLLRAPGWAGPLYAISANGNHRVHTVRMLDLPWLAATVHIEASPPSWDMLELVSSDNSDAERQRLPRQQRLRERERLVTGLLRRGIIDGELTSNGPTLHCRYLPASWLLRAPQYATKVNAIYERCYPGALDQLGIPISVGTDPVKWTHWLHSAADE